MTSRARLLSCALWLGLALGLGCRPSAATQTSGEAGGEQPEPAEPEPAEPTPTPMCDGQACESPRQCVSYYGIAGPAGPLFHSCEIRCDRSHEDGGCPEGMRCVTIADGPGDVCQAE